MHSDSTRQILWDILLLLMFLLLLLLLLLLWQGYWLPYGLLLGSLHRSTEEPQQSGLHQRRARCLQCLLP